MSAGCCQVGRAWVIKLMATRDSQIFPQDFNIPHNVNQGTGTTQGAQITCTCTGIPDWLTPYGADTLWPRWVTVKDKFINTVGVVPQKVCQQVYPMIQISTSVHRR
jgi:hypothetical protein